MRDFGNKEEGLITSPPQYSHKLREATYIINKPVMNIYIYIFLVHQKPHDLVHMVKTYVVKRKLWENMILIFFI